MAKAEGLEALEKQILKELKKGELKMTGASIRLSTPPKGVNMSVLDWSARFGFALLCNIWNKGRDLYYLKVVFHCPGLKGNMDWVESNNGSDGRTFSPEEFPPRLGRLIMARVDGEDVTDA